MLLVVPDGAAKGSTGAVYDAFDERVGPDGFEERADAVLRIGRAHRERAKDLAALPRNDLASSPLTGELERAGAFRADVRARVRPCTASTKRAQDAARAAATFSARGQTFVDASGARRSAAAGKMSLLWGVAKW